MAWDVAKEVFVKARPAAAKAWDALAARLLRTPAPKELAEMLRGEKPRIVELSTAQDGDDTAETSVGTPSQTVSPQGTQGRIPQSTRLLFTRHSRRRNLRNLTHHGHHVHRPQKTFPDTHRHSPRFIGFRKHSPTFMSMQGRFPDIQRK